MYKAIFIDIDGTLRKNNNKISERTILAIKQVIKKGILVILCSGRARAYVETISRECNASRYIITSNGGIIFDYEENKIIHKSIIEKQACIELFKISQQFNTIFIMDKEEIKLTNKLEKYDLSSKILDTDIERFTNEKNIVLCTIKDENSEKMMKIRKKIEEIEDVEIKQEIKSLGDNNTSGREEIYFFIGNTELCKGNAIEKICKILEIDLNDTIAIGDDFNDISMFKVVGYSVVMENATDEVKKYADEITLSNEDDGVAVFLEKLLI